MLFVGVTTGKSSIMRIFPKWARYLGIDARIEGVDCNIHDTPHVYRRIVAEIKDRPDIPGALVTSHKIDLLTAARDLFDNLDPYAAALGEVSCISKRDGKLWGHAKDPITSGLSLRTFLPTDFWLRHGGDLCVFGAGGSSLALTTHVIEESAAAGAIRGAARDAARDASRCGPRRIFVTNRSNPRLEHMKRVHTPLNPPMPIEYVHADTAQGNDRVLAALSPNSVVVNATGLGKDAPGSPVTNHASFPPQSFVWEFNYRGDLLFLRQAELQRDKKDLTIENGWTYFIHGWTRVIAEVFHIHIPTEGGDFDLLSSMATS